MKKNYILLILLFLILINILALLVIILLDKTKADTQQIIENTQSESTDFLDSPSEKDIINTAAAEPQSGSLDNLDKTDESIEETGITQKYENTCEDSDGNNFNFNGHVKFKNVNREDVFYDYCDNGVAFDYFCYGDGTYGLSSKTCESGCKENSCASSIAQADSDESESLYEYNKLYLYKGNGNHENFDIFIIFEQTQTELIDNLFLDYLGYAVGESEYSFFKLKPLDEYQDKFNVYFYIIPEQVYEEGDCEWGLTLPLPEFDKIAAKYPWKDVKVYFNKNPKLSGTLMATEDGKQITYSTECSRVNDNLEFSWLGYGFATTFAHEMGHVFGLQDEYISSDNPGVLDAKNCVSLESDRWDKILGQKAEKFAGCTTTNSYRNSDKSIMSGYYPPLWESDHAEKWPDSFNLISRYYIEEDLKSRGII